MHAGALRADEAANARGRPRRARLAAIGAGHVLLASQQLPQGLPLHVSLHSHLVRRSAAGRHVVGAVRARHVPHHKFGCLLAPPIAPPLCLSVAMMRKGWYRGRYRALRAPCGAVSGT
eukprot:1185664-Prymnesium_polylepis.2